ncbi:MAG: hypothetical protein RL071_3337 [Pseudomonadota bacterium]
MRAALPGRASARPSPRRPRLPGLLLALGAGLAPAAASAGDPGPLCAALTGADAVVEVELQIKDVYPPIYRAKGWAPEAQHLRATLATATVAKTLRGDPAGWTPRVEDLPLGSLSVPQWDALFAAPTVRALVLLDREGPAWRSVGWLEDSGMCAISVCWGPLTAAVKACGLPATPPAAAPR